VLYSGAVPREADEVFVGTVMRYSAGWRTHDNQVKLHLWNTEQGWIGVFDGCRAAPAVRWSIGSRGVTGAVITDGSDCWVNNRAPSPAYTPGTWVKHELYIRRSTGTVMLWVDGVLLAEHHGVAGVRSMVWAEFQHAGTWGGGGGAVTQAQVWSVALTELRSR
jgi:hypothetical protein